MRLPNEILSHCYTSPFATSDVADNLHERMYEMNMGSCPIINSIPISPPANLHGKVNIVLYESPFANQILVRLKLILTRFQYCKLAVLVLLTFHNVQPNNLLFPWYFSSRRKNLKRKFMIPLYRYDANSGWHTKLIR